MHVTAWSRIKAVLAVCLTGSAGGLAGNNAVEMQTTAEYDQGADEFIITTPTTLAQKYWVCPIHLHPCRRQAPWGSSLVWQSLPRWLGHLQWLARLLATHGTAAA